MGLVRATGEEAGTGELMNEPRARKSKIGMCRRFLSAY